MEEETAAPAAAGSGSKASCSSSTPTTTTITPMPPPAPPAAAGSPPPASSTTEALRGEVASLRRRLAELEAERARVRRRRERVAAQRRELRAWAAAWHGRVNAAAAAVTAARGGLRAAERGAAAVGERLGTLARTHVLDDAFFIWHAGPFVTINGLRLGRLPAVGNVEWAEVNGALGLAALLVAAAAERSGYRFRQHQILPMGSFPRIAAAQPQPQQAIAGAAQPPPSSSSSTSSATAGVQHNLYYEETGFSLNPFRRQHFNRALQAFCRCVQELGAFAEERDPTLRLPYRIAPDGAAVGGLAVAFAPGGEEAWTRALKFLMTDIKWLVAWSAKHT